MGYWTRARRAAHPYAVIYSAAGSPFDAVGGLYWTRIESRHRTAAAAERAAARCQAALERHHPGGGLLCGYAAAERSESGGWRRLGDED